MYFYSQITLIFSLYWNIVHHFAGQRGRGNGWEAGKLATGLQLGIQVSKIIIIVISRRIINNNNNSKNNSNFSPAQSSLFQQSLTSLLFQRLSRTVRVRMSLNNQLCVYIGLQKLS